MPHSCALCGQRASRGSDQRHGQFALILQAAPDPCVGRGNHGFANKFSRSGEKVHLHQLSRELEIPLPDFIAPLVDLARELEFNVTFL